MLVDVMPPASALVSVEDSPLPAVPGPEQRDAMVPRSRRVRPANVNLNVCAVVDRAKILAQMRKPGFNFDGSSYENLSRTLVPNIESLRRHWPFITIVIEDGHSQ